MNQRRFSVFSTKKKTSFCDSEPNNRLEGQRVYKERGGERERERERERPFEAGNECRTWKVSLKRPGIMEGNNLSKKNFTNKTTT